MLLGQTLPAKEEPRLYLQFVFLSFLPLEKSLRLSTSFSSTTLQSPEWSGVTNLSHLPTFLFKVSANPLLKAFIMSPL
jgi:hypothetical protein